jgi:cytidylate kinase
MWPMPIVTIRGQLGGGASEIGRQVADRLHIDYIDREIIAKVAELLNENKQDVMAKEMPAGSLWRYIAQSLGFENSVGGVGVWEPSFISPYSCAYMPTWQIPLDDNRYLSCLESVINELARNNNVVICGRGSQFILKDRPGALHILVVAPFETRLKRVMQSLEMDKKSAEKEIGQSDGSRHEFIKRYFKAEMEDAAHYDIVLNTERLDFEDAATIIVNALPLKSKNLKDGRGMHGFNESSGLKRFHIY